MQTPCANCGTPLLERAKFCHGCGTPRASGRSLLPWGVAGIAVLSIVAFIIGWRRGAPAEAPAEAPALRAPDISALSPQERADRLFDRVMTLVSEGKSDSVLFFSPMAIQSYQALTPLDAHRRYDLGLLGVVSGEGAMARRNR